MPCNWMSLRSLPSLLRAKSTSATAAKLSLRMLGSPVDVPNPTLLAWSRPWPADMGARRRWRPKTLLLPLMARHREDLRWKKGIHFEFILVT